MNKRTLILGGVLITLLLVLISRTFRESAVTDSTRYYFLGMASHYSQFGFLDKLPQASQVSWSNEFIDPIPWYTALNGTINRFFGEGGVENFHHCLSFILALLLFYFAYHQTGSYLSIGISCLVLLTPDFATILSNLGPQNLEMIFLVLGFSLLIKRKYVGAQVSFVGFALFSQYLLMSLILLISTSLQHSFQTKRKLKNSLLLFTLVSIPLFAHPFFPNQLNQIFIEHFRYFHPRLSPLSNEIPLRTDHFFSLFWPFLFLSAYGFFKCSRHQLQLKSPQLLILTLNLLLWMWGGIYKPILPYALLMTLIVVFLFLNRETRALEKGLITAVLLLASISFLSVYSTTKKENTFFKHSVNALSQIPREMVGKLVFTCHWEYGNYLFYLRPDLRTLDLYSPILLKYNNPLLFESRNNPTEEILSQLNADYFYCDRVDSFKRLSNSEQFELVYPADKSLWTSRSPYLFARKNLALKKRPLKVGSSLSFVH